MSISPVNLFIFGAGQKGFLKIYDRGTQQILEGSMTHM